MRRLLLIALLTAATDGLTADLGKGLAAVEQLNWAEALAEFRPLAEQGDADAQVNLGNLYMKGLGVEQNYNTAFRWYLRAAEQGQPVAQGKLGLMHYYGLGLKENHEEAVHWFRMAAEGGDVDAASVLAALYADGDGTASDPAEAYYWYTIAIERGRTTAEADREALVDRMSPGEIATALDRLAATRKAETDLIEEFVGTPSAAPRAAAPPKARKPRGAPRSTPPAGAKKTPAKPR